MKIVQINATCGTGSTGKICVAISELLDEEKIENYIFYTQGTSQHKNGVKYANEKYIKIQALKSRVFGNYGFNSKKATKKLIAHLKQIKPDIVHLHNLHSHNCDLELLFKYFKSTKTKLLWTFHDCWAFTGYCAYFDMVDCNKWQIECKKCPKAKQSSWFLDRSATLFNKKKQLFDGLDLTIITPSQWLADLVKQSFLREYPVKVINNGIDLKLFKLTESDFREKYNLLDKYVLLGVAFDWGARKGLDVFIELSKRLGEEYRIVLVGTNNNIDKQLPDNIISIHRTQNQQELAEIYTAADLFVNPTREENFPTVNIESLACGTPVLTFNTGGSPEIIDDTCGAVVPKNDIDGLYSEILRIKSENPYSPAACIEKAKSFNAEEKFKEYLRSYK